MSARATRNLIVQAPDGTDITDSTSGNYDLAGIVKTGRGWALAAHGSSWDSVTRRTRARYNRGDATGMHVALLWEETAGAIRGYFGTHAVRIDMVFMPGLGWQSIASRDASGKTLRAMRKDGITAVHVKKHNPREFDPRTEGDFQMSELLNVQGHLIRAS